MSIFFQRIILGRVLYFGIKFFGTPPKPPESVKFDYNFIVFF